MNHISPRRALVTGATGYLGGQLVKRLAENGWTVGVMGRRSQRQLNFQENNTDIKCYFATDCVEAMSAAMTDLSPSIVFHCAAMTSADTAGISSRELIDANLLFGTNVLNAMAEAEIKHFVNVGSYWEHYNNEEFNPVDLYAASKYAFSNILKFFTEAHGLTACTLELNDVYGTNDSRGKIISILIEATMNGGQLRMSPGHQRLNFVYISDVLDGFLTLANRMLINSPILADRYALRSNNDFSLRETAKIIEDVVGKKLMVDWGAFGYKKRTIMTPPDITPVLDCWQSKITLREGLKYVVESFN